MGEVYRVTGGKGAGYGLEIPCVFTNLMEQSLISTSYEKLLIL